MRLLGKIAAGCGTVDINRNLPAKRFIKPVIFWGRRKIFIAPHDMRYAHQMVVNDICKIISRIAVGFY